MLHYPEGDSLFLRIASQPIGKSAPEDWVAAQIASDDRCTTTEPIIVDGAAGLSGGDTCLVAVVTTAGRGYHIDLWMSPDDRDLVSQYDRSWFEEVLATVDLRPEDAIDAVPLTQTFTSQMHGISVRLPEGWTAQAATEPWTDGPNSHSILDPHDDRLLHPTLTDHLFLSISSQPIGDSTPEDWITEQIAAWADLKECTAAEPIAVDEASGLIGSEGCDLAVVTTDGRGYWISLRASKDDPSAVAPYDRAWFEEVLATVQLHPEDAVD